MQKKTCPNGHVYDASIYGDTCPLCPSSPAPAAAPGLAAPAGGAGAHTRVAAPAAGNFAPHQDMTGHTKVAADVHEMAQEMKRPQQAPAPNKTRIRHAGGMRGPVQGNENDRKLVGFLVTYNRTPMGKAYNIYEGRNMIGRDANCDIAITDDNQMSSHHMSIRYLSGNNKFRFHDEMSSNGTYVNKELLDDGELQNYDIIRVGSTLFVFIAIPQIG